MGTVGQVGTFLRCAFGRETKEILCLLNGDVLSLRYLSEHCLFGPKGPGGTLHIG